MGEEPDLGEAADFIRAERPRLADHDVWTVLNELGVPPPRGADGMAIDLVVRLHPDVRARDVKVILNEWREYACLAAESDWGDD